MADQTLQSNTRYRIGVDVGGTNTDAVVLKFGAEHDADRGVIAWSKARTTADVTGGIATALTDVLLKAAGSVERTNIAYISIGTTHFLNAVVENDARRLARVAVLRLGAPYTAQCPPFVDFPTALRSIIDGHYALLDGGLEIDGNEIRPIRRGEIEAECKIIAAKGIKNIVIVGVFSPLARPGEQEEYVKEIIEEVLGAENVNVVCSKDVGHVGLLERENAAILNASILTFARRTIAAYQAVLRRLSLRCSLFLTQLDGTLIPASEASKVPIRTFSNGPTNSMRGASYLAGLERNIADPGDAKRKSMLVIDVGGTTTDVGVLLPSGFPRKAAAFTNVGGVRTSFSMPDIHSIGLGGGSRVISDQTTGAVHVGPTSVGHNITRDALVFGGSIVTATDLALAARIPDSSPTLHSVPAPLSDSTEAGDIPISPSTRAILTSNITGPQLGAGLACIRHLLESAIDKMKTDAEDIDVLLVGGGSLIVPPSPPLRGVRNIISPRFATVANAVGAAIGRVSGVVDRVEVPGGRGMVEIVAACKEEARRKAVESGAEEASVEVVEVEVVELPYVANQASRIVVRAVGDLRIEGLAHRSAPSNDNYEGSANESLTDIYAAGSGDETAPTFITPGPERQDVDITTYKPSVSANGEWSISELDLEWIAEGCAILGCGGGGATYPTFLPARNILREGGKIVVVDHTYFNPESNHQGAELPNDGWILPVGYMGSPSVGSERIPAGTEVLAAVKALMAFYGIERKDVAGVVSDEIGGKNGLEPMLLASRPEFGCPVLDGDLMGRAYPRLNQILPTVYKKQEAGASICPAAGADAVGNSMIIPTARSNLMVEKMLRATCTELGSSLALAIAPMRVSEFGKYAIPRTTSQAWWVGRAVAQCRSVNDVQGIPHAIAEVQGGKVLFVGKIVDVQRVVRGGFTHGRITIAPLRAEEVEGVVASHGDENDDGDGNKLIVPFQNENLVAELHGVDGSRNILCIVPDLIAVLDSQNGSSIGTQDYRYGLRVSVVGMACTPRWRTKEALAVGGPGAFGMDNEYVPIGEYVEPRSIIQEYRSRV